MTTVSIVIPVYNSGRYLAATLDSVLAQSMPDWEAIVVDDGSRDHSPAIARAYAERDHRIRVVQRPNGGVAVARNHGLRMSDRTTPHVIFLDADDVWEPDALAVLLTATQADVAAAGAHASAFFMDAEGLRIREGELEGWVRERRHVVQGRPAAIAPGQPTTFGAVLFWPRIPTPGTVLVRRAALEAVGEFNPCLSPADDWDLWLRLSRRAHFAFVDVPVLGYRQHDAQATRGHRRMRGAQLRTRRSILDSCTPGSRDYNLVIESSRWWRRENSEMWWQWARRSIAQRQFLAATNQARHATVERLLAHVSPVLPAIVIDRL